MSRIESFNTAFVDNTGLQSRTGHGIQSSVGQFFGQQVQVDGVDSMLSDAAEEISMHHAEKAESKHSSERRKEASQPLNVMNVEAIMAYLDAAHAYEDPEQLVQLAKRMLSGQGDPAQHARQAFDEPTGQFMALQYALQQGEREGAASDVLEALRESLLDLEMAHGPAIRADINTVGTAAEAGSSRAEIARFQGTYRDVVLGDATLAGTLKLALERFGEQDFSLGLKQLTQALGQDMTAAHPSRDRVRLESLVTDVFRLAVIGTLLERCEKLLVELADKHGVSSSLSPAQLMGSLVDISAESWISGQRFTDLSQSCGAHVPQAQIPFVHTAKGLIRDLPVQLFVDLEQRQMVLDAAQDALDMAIDREVT